jgi:chromosomal replication initiation ATPase DnaA
MDYNDIIVELKSLIKAERKIDIKDALNKAVLYCEVLGWYFDELKSRCKFQEICDKRFVLYYALYTYDSFTLKMIGNVFDYDHSTVLHGINQIRYEIDRNRLDVKNILKTLITLQHDSSLPSRPVEQGDIKEEL